MKWLDLIIMIIMHNNYYANPNTAPEPMTTTAPVTSPNNQGVMINKGENRMES